MYENEEVPYNLDKLPSLPESLGRNGYYQTKGLAVLEMHLQIELVGVNSRDQLAKGSVALPKDPEVLRDLANKLVQKADQIEANHNRKAA